MIFPKFRAMGCVAVLCGVCLYPSGRLFAQAPPGPLPPSHPLPPPPPAPPAKKKPEAEPRKTLAGFWKLNADESDDPQRKLEEARQTRAGSGGGPGGGTGGGGPQVGIGFPYPGGGPNGPNGPNGPYGGGGRGMGGDNSETTEEMKELVRPDFSQSIELKDAEVDSTDNHDNKLVLYTDGRKIQKSKDDSLKQISAHWNGSQLITDEKGPRGKKMNRTFELSSDGRQFYETWHIENGRSGSVTVIRYVYDAATEYER